jgi:hypothetical protein
MRPGRQEKQVQAQRVLRDRCPSNGAITHAEPDCLAWGAEFRSRDGELTGCGGASLNWWPGNRGTAWLQQCHEKYRCNSWADDTPERRGLS